MGRLSSRHTWGRAVVLGVVAVFVLAALAPAARAQARVTVAVLYFDYNGAAEDMAFLRKGLAEMLVTDLVDIPGVEVVERMKLEAVLEELDLNRTKSIDRKAALQVGKLLGARYLVAGSYTVYKESMVLSLRVLEVETGKVVIGRQNHKGKLDEFFDMEQKIAEGLREIMSERLKAGSGGSQRQASADDGASDVAPAKKASKRRPSQPKTAKTRNKAKKPARLHARTAARYGKALDAADRGDKKTARAELEAVVKEQPDFELAAIDLASLAQ